MEGFLCSSKGCLPSLRQEAPVSFHASVSSIHRRTSHHPAEATAQRPLRLGGMTAAATVAGAGFALSRRRRRHRDVKKAPRCSGAVTARKAAQDNVALVFVKPHAATPEVLKLVPEFLEARGIKVIRSGSVSAKEIEDGGIIDSHYAAIAKIGMARDMSALGLGPNEAKKFEAGYGRTLDDALAAKEVCSAVTAMEILGVDASELLRRNLEAGYEKLRSGLYCARLEGGPNGQLFVLNGFYSRMREKFTSPGVVVHCFVVCFEESKLPWSKFRSEIIGSTNPKDAVDGSLRARIRDDWKDLGLAEETNYQDNGVHASAGPLEALRERMVWLGEDPAADDFGNEISSRCSIAVSQLVDNPDVELQDGRKGSAFDLLEDLGSEETLEALSAAKLVA
eukprot:TRINITY_DN84643_c0_g1_i1.p1 TRINITY_DN84643_c0_g1~~TRINITY_DN84643_c0_g1_i1.p1  ORF type:complete len:394 (+),score=106.25 TRINITY_DN84643_c0_g1_i1:65-1246(+)